jgi:FkbM family methyltransferase
MNFFICCLAFSSLVAQEIDPTYSLQDWAHVPLDYKLVKLLNRREGIFVEVGANDGILQSNTKLLEERYGWRGVLVEPSPTLFEVLKQNRPGAICFQCALGAFRDEGRVMKGDFDGGLMASLGGQRNGQKAKYAVKIRSLQSILDETGIKHVDFMSLDTEGYELEILRGIDFSRTTFDYLLVETYTCDHQQIVDLLAANGYKLVECFSGYNSVANARWDGKHNDYLFRRSNQ